MTEVLLHTEMWHSNTDGLPGRGFDPNTQAFHLPCGLVIPRENITSPAADGWDGVSYVIRFAEEKDAVYFVLAVGGKIFPKN